MKPNIPEVLLLTFLALITATGIVFCIRDILGEHDDLTTVILCGGLLYCGYWFAYAVRHIDKIIGGGE